MREPNLVMRSWLGSGSINIIGKPNSGKDLHSEVIAPEFDAVVLGAGKKLRADADMDTRDRALMEAGVLIPSDTFFAKMFHQFQNPELVGKPFFLTAVGRVAGEPQPVADILRAAQHPLRAVIHVVISDEIARQRRGNRGDRPDDSPEAFEVRLEEFATKTLPAIEEYRSILGEVIEIDGDAPRHIVTGNIRSELARLSGLDPSELIAF